MMKDLTWFHSYVRLIKFRPDESLLSGDGSLIYWRNELFYNFVLYTLPISLIAVCPGIYASLKDGIPTLAAIDALSFALLCVAAFVPGIRLAFRKLLVISVFYALAIFLTNTLGYIGPGVMYLFGISILISLIAPIRFGFLSVIVNTLILFGYAMIIHYRLFDSPLIGQYSMRKWVAFSCNITFFSTVIVCLLQRLFSGLTITLERKNAHKKRYSEIFENSPLPMWLFDTTTLKFLEVNNAAIRQYGFSEEEFLNMSINDIRPDQDVNGIRELVERNAISGQYYKGRSRHKKKSGEVIHVDVQSNLLKYESSCARLVLANDVTLQLKAAEIIDEANAIIKKSEANLRAIFENTIDGFVLLDKDFQIITFNGQAQKYMTFQQEANIFVENTSILDYVEPEKRDSFQRLLMKAAKGNVIEYDRNHINNNHSQMWVKYVISPVYEDGDFSGFCLTGRDITSRMSYIKTIERQNKTLRDIAWMQSHLVRAPLARILGIIGLLNDYQFTGDEKLLLSYLSNSSDELDKILRDIVIKSASVNDLLQDTT